MTITEQQFRNDFPEFGDAVTFPPSQINFWSGVATNLLNPVRWRGSLQIALELFIAHNVALEAQAQLGAEAGGIPGINRGVVSAETGPGVAASYDTASALVPDAGHWNLTTYGTRLMWLVNMFGAGPIQIGTGFGCAGVVTGFFQNGGYYGGNCGPGWSQTI